MKKLLIFTIIFVCFTFTADYTVATASLYAKAVVSLYPDMNNGPYNAPYVFDKPHWDVTRTAFASGGRMGWTRLNAGEAQKGESGGGNHHKFTSSKAILDPLGLNGESLINGVGRDPSGWARVEASVNNMTEKLTNYTGDALYMDWVLTINWGISLNALYSERSRAGASINVMLNGGEAPYNFYKGKCPHYLA